MLELSITGTAMMLLRKWAQQGRVKQFQIFRRGVPVLGAVLALAPVVVVWDSLPAAPAGPVFKANSSTTSSMVTAAIRVWGSNRLTIMNNVFNGALGVLYPADPTNPISVQAVGASGDNAAVRQCGNSYAVNATQLDAPCASSG